MTNTQRLTIRASEIRQRLNEISGLEGDALTDEVRAESDALTTEYRDTETRLRAAVAAEGDPSATPPVTEDAELRERRELRARVTLSDYLAAAVAQGDAGRAGGAAAEYAAAAGCPGMVPLDMFGPTMEERQEARQRSIEQRAVTPAPADSKVPSTHAPIVPAIFDRSVGAFMGVEMPTAATGIASFPVLSTNLTGGMKAESGAADEGAGAFTVTDADPRRLTGAFRIRKEDIAKLPSLESALRGNMSAVLSDEYDKQLVTGDGTAPNLNGLQTQLTAATAPAAGAETYVRYAAAFASHIDGLFATTPGDVRGLVGPHTLRHMASTFGTTAGDRSSYAMLAGDFGGVRATRRIASPASNIQQAIIRRANPAGDRVAVAPVWMGLEVIRDPYTAAAKGEVVITGTILVGGIVMLRSAAFVADSFRLA